MRQGTGRMVDRIPGGPAIARVALATTGIVAAVYVVISAAVVMVVSHNLTAATDRRLTSALAHLQRGEPLPPGRVGLSPYQDTEGRQFGAPILQWVVLPDNGVVAPPNQTAVLPADALHTTEPRTVSISGTGVRVVGGPADVLGAAGWMVVGQATSAVSQARTTVLIAEVLVAPPLLLIVFIGALTIGRRAAAPIERARRRQLDFTADASHELRTPLSVIEAETSLALSAPRGAEAYRTTITRVDAESKRLRRLVDDLLWLSRFDATPDPPGAELVDLGVVARGAVERFGMVAERRSLRLTGDVDPEVSALITAPPDWLERLLGVLLDNACRYGREGGEVTVRVGSSGSRVQMTVEDDGPGIPAEERDRIFDRFHRATTTPGGAGLGLAIGDAIVRATGGRWAVGESPAGGASMGVVWPRSPST
jgi:signal transduction histidine kinase